MTGRRLGLRLWRNYVSISGFATEDLFGFGRCGCSAVFIHAACYGWGWRRRCRWHPRWDCPRFYRRDGGSETCSAAAPSLLSTRLCGAAPAAALLVSTARGMERLRLYHSAGSGLQLERDEQKCEVVLRSHPALNDENRWSGPGYPGGVASAFSFKASRKIFRGGLLDLQGGRDFPRGPAPPARRKCRVILSGR